MIPASPGPPGPAWEAARARDPVVRRYRALFAVLDWSAVPDRDARRPWPGRPPHPTAAYVKALLVKICEGKPFVTDLRAFLVEHPWLVLELGFRPVLDPAAPDGFAVERTVPGARWLRRQQQTLDPAVLGRLLAGTVAALRAAIPGLGTTVAVDVKHLYAWVRENNSKETVRHRFDPARQPRGDPDCRLGVKRRANQGGTAAKEYLWGYGSGIASATDPVHGDVVLAEVTRPFHRQDVTWYRPVYLQAVANLGRPPTNVAADAAFDAWHVYETCAARGGLAAVAPNRRGPAPARDPDGRPRCDRGLAMAPGREFVHEDGYRARAYGCPLLRPLPTGATCPDPRFAAGRGCSKRINLEAGGRMRAEIDRSSDAYRAVYRQRTSAERINSQAKALGIERPRVRSAAAVRRLNTLTYVVINAHALLRLRTRAAARPPPHVMSQPTLPITGEGGARRAGVRAVAPLSPGYRTPAPPPAATPGAVPAARPPSSGRTTPVG